ncbi:NAD(P)H-binding protein [Candidatus Villigracilis saccharophilus]|uniref:NAD(P)H-binding protein n=1 Tax=Candidatus Villigracilis saccharophilus TaxID=3140684 RepID=UPI003136A49D|nr:NAD(P)H-binding protein [Anaerolineales bacterium]
MPNSSKLILVTGATGYIASRLIPQLITRGYRIRALARQPQRLKNKNWFPQVDVTQGDVMDAKTLTPAFAGVEIAYYLIHNMSSGRGYTERELEGARNFALAAEAAGVRQIIYLGGLADEEQHIAPHMRSRIETGATLRQGKVPVTEFRAGVVAGSGSISFEMIRFMTELFPIIPAPFWVKNKSQPISTQNVIDYLLAALDNHDGQGQVFEIGGPHVTTYQELMLSYARARGLKRSFLLLPYVPVWFMAFGIGLTTPVPSPIAYALVGGLSSDSVVMHDNALRVYPEVNLIDFESAAKEALTRLHPHKIERVWDDGEGHTKTLKHEGFFIDHREIKLNAAPEKIFDAVKKMTGNFLVEAAEEGQILVQLKTKMPGSAWVQWKAERVFDATNLTQTFFFTPRGLAGFLIWYLLRPFSILVFKNWLKNIARNSVVK